MKLLRQWLEIAWVMIPGIIGLHAGERFVFLKAVWAVLGFVFLSAWLLAAHFFSFPQWLAFLGFVVSWLLLPFAFLLWMAFAASAEVEESKSRGRW